VSLIRGLLGVDLDEVVVSARDFRAPLVDPRHPDGWDTAAVAEPRTTTLATLDFGGRSGLYDFTENQWWNPLRARRIVVRGSTGEIVDDTVTRMVDPVSPVSSELSYRRRGIDLDLEGVDLDFVSFDGRVVYRNGWADTRLSDDDIAVAELLARTGAWARGDGPAPYPLAQGCQDPRHRLGGRGVGADRDRGARRATGVGLKPFVRLDLSDSTTPEQRSAIGDALRPGPATGPGASTGGRTAWRRPHPWPRPATPRGRCRRGRRPRRRQLRPGS